MGYEFYLIIVNESISDHFHVFGHCRANAWAACKEKVSDIYFPVKIGIADPVPILIGKRKI
jgi:hypothetical protein